MWRWCRACIATCIFVCLILESCGGHKYDTQQEDDPSVLTMHMLIDFDVHLDRFASTVQGEASKREASWQHMADEFDRVLARLDLPLSEDEPDDFELSSITGDIFADLEPPSTTTTTVAATTAPIQDTCEEVCEIMAISSGWQEVCRQGEASSRCLGCPACNQESNNIADGQNSAESTLDESTGVGTGDQAVNENNDLGVDSAVGVTESNRQDDTSSSTIVSTSQSSTVSLTAAARVATSEVVLEKHHSSAMPNNGVTMPNKSGSINSSFGLVVTVSNQSSPSYRLECKSGQAVHKTPRLKVTTDNSEDGCARECERQLRCVAFDYMTNPQSDACRLFDSAVHQIRAGGPGHRHHCFLTRTKLPKTLARSSTAEHTPLVIRGKLKQGVKSKALSHASSGGKVDTTSPRSKKLSSQILKSEHGNALVATSSPVVASTTTSVGTFAREGASDSKFVV